MKEVDYVAVMERRRRYIFRFGTLPIVVGFCGLILIGGTCHGWRELEAMTPWVPMDVSHGQYMILQHVIWQSTGVERATLSPFNRDGATRCSA